MSERRKTTPPNENETISPRVARAQAKRRQLNILLITIATIVILFIGAAFLYQLVMAPYQRVVLKVDNTVVRMDYFLRRARLASDDIDATLKQLTYEEVVKIEAKDLKLTISEPELDQALLDTAAADNVTAESLKDKAYKEWYSEQLKYTDLTSAQYRDRMRVNLMAQKIQQAMVASMGDTAEQVHLYTIVLGSTSSANQAKARLESGESFASVAQAMSLDTSTSDIGGDWGWMPQGILYKFDDTIFALEPGQVSTIITDSSSSTTYYYIFMVSEKDAARALDNTMKSAISYNAFIAWLESQMTEHTIEYLMTTDNRAWVTWQLSKD